MDTRNIAQPKKAVALPPNPFMVMGLTLGYCLQWIIGAKNTEILKNPVPLNNPDDAAAVFCVHGTADHPSGFRKLSERLMMQSLGNIAYFVLAGFDCRFTGMGIDDFALQFKAIVKDFVTKNNIKRIYIMGHSRGGDIAAYYAVNFPDVKIDGVMSLGSPFGGSDKAMFPLTYVSKSVEQMQMNTPFLCELRKSILKSHIPFYYFAAEHDSIVPLNSTFVSGAEDRLIILRGHNHLTMLTSWKLVDHILNVLVGKIRPLSLATAQQELGVYIEEFKNTYHVFSAESKLKILEKLYQLFNDLIVNNGQAYPGVKKIGHFIQSFLEDKNLLTGYTPYQILNCSLTFFQLSNTSTINFLSALMLRYKNIDIPNRTLLDSMLLMEQESNNETFGL